MNGMLKIALFCCAMVLLCSCEAASEGGGVPKKVGDLKLSAEYVAASGSGQSLLPAGMEQSADQFLFVSADPSIATVDAKGVVTFVKTGETVITVSEKSNPANKREVVISVPIALEDVAFAELCKDPSIDPNGDGYVTVKEAKLVRVLQLNGTVISTLSGIEYFTELLELSDNQLSGRGQLTAVDLTKNTKLRVLRLPNHQISTIDLSQNLLLDKLDLSANPLTGLDVSMLPLLVELSCENASLRALDLTHNPDLRRLSIENTISNMPLESDNHFASIDLSGNPKLTHLWCRRVGLERFDPRPLSDLVALHCPDNLLTQIDVSGNAKLQELDCTLNRLTALDVTSNAQLTSLACGYNNFATIDVSHNAKLKNLAVRDLNLTQLNVAGNPLLEYLSCDTNKLTTLLLQTAPKLKALTCGRNNDLVQVDLSGCPDLETVEFDYCSKLSVLNLAGATKLQTIRGYINKITALDVTHCPQLRALVLPTSMLTGVLDISKNTKLVELNLTDALLQTIYVWPGFNTASPPDGFYKDDSTNYVVK